MSTPWSQMLNGLTTRSRRANPSEDPNSKMGQSPNLEQSLVQPLPAAPTVSQHSGGFLSRLKDSLVGLALGGPVGGIASLINPQLAHNARFNLIDKPSWEKDTQFENQLQNSQTQRASELGQLSGIDPLTGKPTEQARYREAQLQNTKAIADQNAIIRQQMANAATQKAETDSQYKHGEEERKRAADNMRAYNGYMKSLQGGGPLDKNRTDYIKKKFGIDVPVGLDTTRHIPLVDESGQINMFPVSGSGPINQTGVTSFETTKEKNKTSRARILAGAREQNQATKGEPTRDQVYHATEGELDKRFPKLSEDDIAREVIKPKYLQPGEDILTGISRFKEEYSQKREEARAKVYEDVHRRLLEETPNPQQQPGVQNPGVENGQVKIVTINGVQYSVGPLNPQTGKHTLTRIKP